MLQGAKVKTAIKRQCTGVTTRNRRCKNMTIGILCHIHVSSLIICDKYTYIYIDDNKMSIGDMYKKNKHQKWLNTPLDPQDEQMCIPDLRIVRYKWERKYGLNY